MTIEDKSEFILSVKDIQQIKSAAFNHIHDILPRNLDHDALRTLLICKGLIEFLGNNNISLPVKIKYEWERHIKS